jgi:hypothetical protein
MEKGRVGFAEEEKENAGLSLCFAMQVSFLPINVFSLSNFLAGSKNYGSENLT